MAATDLLVEVGDPGSATTLSSPGYTSGSSTSINVASTSNWPSTGKAVIFAIDEAEVVDGEEVQVAGTYNEYEGTVASATSVSNVAWQRGSGDRNYSAGSLTRVYIPVSAERENRLVEWGSAEHSEADGTHSDITADSVTLNASGNIDVPSGASIRDGNDNELVTFSQTASAVNELTVKNAATGNGPEIQATGGDTNIDVEVIPKGTGKLTVGGNPISHGAWTSWTPTYTNITVGNGTVTAKYTQIGKTVHFRYKLDIGSTTTVANSFRFSLPVTAHSDYAHYEAIGQAIARDATAADEFGGIVQAVDTDNAEVVWPDHEGSANDASTFPINEDSSDYLTISGTYEAA